jgi:hypothetical protein
MESQWSDEIGWYLALSVGPRQAPGPKHTVSWVLLVKWFLPGWQWKDATTSDKRNTCKRNNLPRMVECKKMTCSNLGKKKVSTSDGGEASVRSGFDTLNGPLRTFLQTAHSIDEQR